MIFPHGVTLTQLGTDHIHLNDHLDITGVALAITVLGWLENQDHPALPVPAANLDGP
jgi:hypothetical protein